MGSLAVPSTGRGRRVLEPEAAAPGAPRRGGDADEQRKAVADDSPVPVPPCSDFRGAVSTSPQGAGSSLCGTDSRPVSRETIKGREARDLRQDGALCPYDSSRSMAVRTSHWTL